MSHERHEYDGIIEEDNPLPNWWLATFFATIIFAFLYYIHYTFGGGLTQDQELALSLKERPSTAEKSWSEEELRELFSTNANIDQGRLLFGAKCAACHGNEGQGVIGPNLTDRFWLHGKGERKEILNLIRQGVVANGMPAWADMMTDQEIIQVASFVASIKDTKPAHPKAPQGQEAKE